MVQKLLGSLEKGIRVVKNRGIEINIKLGGNHEWELTSLRRAVNIAVAQLDKFRGVFRVESNDANRQAGERILQTVLYRLSDVLH